MRLRQVTLPAALLLLSYSLNMRTALAEYDTAAADATAAPAAPAAAEAADAPAEKGPPLPFHTIEGVGGGAITPMAYLVNPAPKGEIFGEPSVALSYVNLGSKNLDAISVTENLFGFIELGYAADRFGLGTLPSAILAATHTDIEESDVWDARIQAVKEDELWPAITIGIDAKYNDGISAINDRLGGALTGIGYKSASGQDYTVTFSKTLPKAFGFPVILTAGIRASEAANLGFLGFSNTYSATFEGSVAALPTDWLLLAYEFREKTDPYGQIPGLINGEDNWHAFDAGLILDKRTTFVLGYGIFGSLANTEANSAWWLQFKHEF
jgi:hypothetical protein